MTRGADSNPEPCSPVFRHFTDPLPCTLSRVLFVLLTRAVPPARSRAGPRDTTGRAVPTWPSKRQRKCAPPEPVHVIMIWVHNDLRSCSLLTQCRTLGVSILFKDLTQRSNSAWRSLSVKTSGKEGGRAFVFHFGVGRVQALPYFRKTLELEPHNREAKLQFQHAEKVCYCFWGSD